MIVKQFDEQLYNKYDKMKMIFLEYLTTNGVNAEINSDQYGIDIVEVDGDKKWEVTVKEGWGNGRYPFTDLRIVERKKINNEYNTFIVVLNKYGNKAGIVKAKSLTKDKLKNIPNIYFEGGEERFFVIPLNEVFFIDLPVEYEQC